jgi:hypothetical protein
MKYRPERKKYPTKCLTPQRLNPVPGGITGRPALLRFKHGNLALQFGGVYNLRK